MFRAESFAHAVQWLASLTGTHGLAGAWTFETAALAALVAACLVIVRACPNSQELLVERLGALPQVGLAAASALSILLMNYGSRFLYLQF